MRSCACTHVYVHMYPTLQFAFKTTMNSVIFILLKPAVYWNYAAGGDGLNLSHTNFAIICHTEGNVQTCH